MSKPKYKVTWEVKETGDPERPWGIYGDGVLCWVNKRFTTATNSIRKGLNGDRWDPVLKRWKPSFLADGVNFPERN